MKRYLVRAYNVEVNSKGVETRKFVCERTINDLGTSIPGLSLSGKFFRQIEAELLDKIKALDIIPL